MPPVVRVARYLAFLWVPLALGAALVIKDPGWTIAAALSGVLVPMILVVVATILDRNGPHRPDDGIRRSPARSA
jgi:hypothetical protein